MASYDLSFSGNYGHAIVKLQYLSGFKQVGLSASTFVCPVDAGKSCVYDQIFDTL
jgi:hypothetical protein